MLTLKSINWKGLFIWSNQFYGVCAVCLTIGSSVTLLHKIPNLFILSFVYLATILFYSQAYLHEFKEGVLNERANWYQKNTHYLLLRQCIMLFLLAYIGFFKLHLISRFLNSASWIKGIFISTLLISISYYYPFVINQTKYSFRKIGLLKSFSIAWSWSILCLFFPIWIMLNVDFPKFVDPLFFGLYFLQFFLYIFILAMLLDIKDSIDDQAHKVNTLVLNFGMKNTLRLVLIPLLLLFVTINGLMICQQALGLDYLVFQSILAIVTYLIAKQIVHFKSIATHILFVDGLLLVKGILGFILI